MTNILEISASGRTQGSLTRRLTGELVDALADRPGDTNVTRRDLAAGLNFVDDQWIGANFTAPEDRSDEQRATLAESDAMVNELRAADVVVIGAPMYNFSVPAVLKAWIDMIARAGLTFRYTESGPEGLLKGKKAFVVIATGGVPIDGAADFATPYLRHAFSFLGIDDVEIISASQAGKSAGEALDAARTQIAELVDAQPARRVA
ncbi:MAG: NAD(P)H-dependent oxidoreductase [Woeseiaceae bacterium]|nr:NAD(P)H-dependent oxidoreductase [Woeseiaceae bacterium]